MKSEFFSKYKKDQLRGLPKYVELREVLRNAILDGYWKSGEQLPPEKMIAESTPFSLGTVQKALRGLVEERIVERKQGHGSFVSDKLVKMLDPWHFRFSDSLSGDFLKVFPTVVSKKKVAPDTQWARAINPEDGSLIQIDRIIRIMNESNEFRIYSKFYLSAIRFESFPTKSDKELNSTNFKTILYQEYHVSFSNISTALQMVSLPEEVCGQIEVIKGTVGLLMEVLAMSKQNSLIYYQEVYIPPNKFKLHIASPYDIPECWG